MLTRIFDEVSEHGFQETPPGMAFWVGTGPYGATCKGCTFYEGRRCLKYRRLTGYRGKQFRAETPSCKYFEPSKK